MYLFGCLLDEGMLMGSEADDESEEVVKVSVVEGVGHTFGFYY